MLPAGVIGDETAAAIAAADIEPTQVLVQVHQRAYVANGRPSGHYRPGQPAAAEDRLGLRAKELAKLNDGAALQLHRIVLYADYGPDPGTRWLFAAFVMSSSTHASSTRLARSRSSSAS